MGWKGCIRWLVVRLFVISIVWLRMMFLFCIVVCMVKV